jgi:hypothetical protein
LNRPGALKNQLFQSALHDDCRHCKPPQPFNQNAEFCPDTPCTYTAADFLLTRNHHAPILASPQSKFLSMITDHTVDLWAVDEVYFQYEKIM